LAVIGYCFGGLCALDLARSGDDRVKAAVSVHGVFAPPGLGPQGPISASVLVQHGYADPMAPPKDLLQLAEELTAAGADWQVHAYGHALHAFTAEGVHHPELGLAFNEKAARRSHESRTAFLRETFALG
jgi:dienelactone hydrolase